MAYHIYTTEGIILKALPFGEANVLLYILTKDLGLIVASAQSSRLLKSKLRHGLQEYAHITASLVKGRNGWKLTDVSEKGSFFFDLPKPYTQCMVQVFFVLLKTIIGEMPQPAIFETVRTGSEFLAKTFANANVRPTEAELRIRENDIKNFEILLVLRILYELGYVAQSENTETFLASLNLWNSDLLQKISAKKQPLVQIINKALKESQL
ncbi:MAG: recombination protein O N-terminal domain-containing protein [Candidatus Zambryskibacteria bacterium]|nr:recombination protein O N-terminal domain-containing protein [Candidatus Zambryskibacteria bacterium]